MNRKIMEAFGLKGFADKVDDSKCPFCGKVIHPNAEFRDDISRREFNLSGLCQGCQDKTFGK